MPHLMTVLKLANLSDDWVVEIHLFTLFMVLYFNLQSQKQPLEKLYKTGVLKNFEHFQENTCVGVSFSCKYCKIFKSTDSDEHWARLLLQLRQFCKPQKSSSFNRRKTSCFFQTSCLLSLLV